MENAGAVGQTRATRGISATTTKNGACPVHDDRRLFEMLILEGFQAGLSWECVLNKQEAFRRAFDDFDWDKVAAYDEARQAALYADPGIIRQPAQNCGGRGQRRCVCRHPAGVWQL